MRGHGAISERAASSAGFQPLDADDRARYGEPPRIYLDPPVLDNPRCRRKLARWLRYRTLARSRTSEHHYLRIPNLDHDGEPPILLAAVIQPPPTIDAYLAPEHNKKRYRLRGTKAYRRGYRARAIHPREHAADISATVRSLPHRQGRTMSETLRGRPADYDFPEYDFGVPSSYRDLACGVFAPDSRLVAYLLGRRVGEHVRYEEIMGHGDHLANDVMSLLHFAFLELCIASEEPPACLNYGPWYSDPGLDRWKRKVRFKPAYLVLRPGAEAIALLERDHSEARA